MPVGEIRFGACILSERILFAQVLACFVSSALRPQRQATGPNSDGCHGGGSAKDICRNGTKATVGEVFVDA